MEVSSFGIGIPRNRERSQAEFIATLKPSMAMMKRNGESESPCRTPLEMGNSFVGDLLTKTDALEDERHSMIQALHFRAVQIRTIIGGGNGGTNLGHLFQFAANQFSAAGALLSAQHITASTKK
ncbi:hypothetical protein LXL04_031874 [Taraxacum kok-saghyz]